MSMLALSVMEYRGSKEVCLALSPVRLAVVPACCVSEQRSCSNPIPSLSVPPLCYKEITHHNPGKTANGAVKLSLPTGTDSPVLQDLRRIPL